MVTGIALGVSAPGTVVTLPPGFALHRLVGRVRGIELREGERAEMTAPQADANVILDELEKRLARVVAELARSTSMLTNERFTLKNAVKRMEKLGTDPMLPVLTEVPRLPRALERLNDWLKRSRSP